jgi:hypothetical protein
MVEVEVEETRRRSQSREDLPGIHFTADTFGHETVAPA